MLQWEVTEGMSMLKSITLENYKCFDNASIDIAPLTVLCGVNSSGKSSIIKSLLMMKQSFENNKSNGEITYNGEYVNNGCYETLVNNSLSSNLNTNINISTVFDINIKHNADRLAYRDLYRLTFGKNIKSEEFRSYYKLPFKLTLSADINKKVIKNYIITIEHDKLLEPITIEFNHRGNRSYDIFVYNLVLTGSKVCDNNSISIPKCTCSFDGIRIISIFTSFPPSNIDVSQIFNYIYVIFKDISLQFIDNIEHITPLRFSPNRYYISNEIYNSVGHSGENAVQCLYNYRDREITNVIAPTNQCLSFDLAKEKVPLTVNNWLKYMDVGTYNISDIQEDVLQLKVNNHSVADVGFGVSQIFPIVVQGLIMDKYKTLLLEQPEIHLHPKAQMKMADFLLSLAYNNKNTIVETHSDHIINRITRRVMENTELSNLVRIYFVYKDNDGTSKINKEIKIDKFKGLINCPQEFFDQYGDELRIIMEQGFNNYKKKYDGNDKS